jgi:hypothetical protein
LCQLLLQLSDDGECLLRRQGEIGGELSRRMG